MNSKDKGGQFERDVCKQLSLWLTDNERSDCLWRSAMSGGRATVAHRKGESVRQAGDICAVSPEGHALMDIWYIECKFYKDLMIDSFFTKHIGPLVKFWDATVEEASIHGKRWPVLIAKQNSRPTLMLTRPNESLRPRAIVPLGPDNQIYVYQFDEFLATVKPPRQKLRSRGLEIKPVIERVKLVKVTRQTL